MTISVWRYSHLALAVSSFIFIALACVTGAILAVEPLCQKAQPYGVAGFDDITVAQAVPVLKERYTEVFEITIDHNQFMIVKAIDSNGNDVEVYADPKTGASLGNVTAKSAFFQWMTNLHRSLFLHETGRFFVGLTAFILLLIAISGSILVIQRQRGWKRFFNRVIRENFAQYYHVVLGRLSLIPILLIALSGTYLSLIRFELFTADTISHKIDFDSLTSVPAMQVAEFKLFKDIPLSKVQRIEFPFSEDVEDYYTLKLDDREVVVNQHTGEVLSEVPYAKTTLFTQLSLDLHTGRASILWAIILGVASVNILFFIYSGFAMTFRRRGNRVKNRYKSHEANIIILVGSENGSTFRFATAIHEQLIRDGYKSFLAELNDYTIFPAAQQLLVLTATYGLGDAPANGSRFIRLLAQHSQRQSLHFAVLGFGSHSYPEFCQFAYEANNALSLQEWAVPLLEIHTINDRSPEAFERWIALWSQSSGITIKLSATLFSGRPDSGQKFRVTSKTSVTHEQGAFLIRLQPLRKVKFKSGDLLSIHPANDYRERQYSVGKLDGEVQLSVKLHTAGLGSGYLYTLEPGKVISANILRNTHFYFPRKASSVILISNGTGIAPFLGMIGTNTLKTSCHLYCGFRSESSFALYQDQLGKSVESGRLSTLNVAYSREGTREYVKDLLLRDQDLLRHTLQNNGTIMICGSLSMQQNVIELLENCCENGLSVSHYQAHGQILMDCY